MARTTFTGPVRSLNGFEGAMVATSVELESDNGNKINLDAPNGLAANYNLVFPPNDGNSGQVLTTDGSGVTTWTTNGVGTVTSVGGTGTVNGLSLSGTVTSTGSLTLGGTLDLSAPPAIGGGTPAAGTFTAVTATSVGVTNTSSSTSLFEPVAVVSTLTGAGVTGGRAKFDTTINSAAGSFTNALKANVTYGAAGKTTGLGSAFVAEMTLSAGTVDGTYAPLELELTAATGNAAGTATSLIYASVNGSGADSVVNANATLLNLQGVTTGSAGATDMVTAPGSSFAATDLTSGIGIKVKVGANFYYIPLVAAADYQDN
jgi:hypothetical protein